MDAPKSCEIIRAAEADHAHRRNRACGRQRQGLAKRIGFRFVFSYLVLYNVPFPLGVLPWTSWLADKYEKMWEAMIIWTGKHVLHLPKPITFLVTGSGDTIPDYVHQLMFVVLATAATIGCTNGCEFMCATCLALPCSRTGWTK